MKKSKIHPKKQWRLIDLFVTGSTARAAAAVVGVNFKSAALYFHRLRQIIEMASWEKKPFEGEIEVDESYFGGARKGRRGRGAAGKTPVFGLLKRGGKVYAQIIPDAKGKTLMGIMEKKIVPDSLVYTDSFRAYNVLDVSSFTHHRINHKKHFALGKNHINGIENFWSQAKRHLRKFNGVPKDHFFLYLKECEWRFNNPDLSMQIRLLRRWVKKYMG